MRPLTLLWPMTDEPAQHDAAWGAWYSETKTAACHHEILGDTPDPVIITVYGANVALGFLGRFKVDFIRDDLRAVLSPEINEAFAFGSIHHVIDGPVRGMSTYWPHSRAVPWMRGNSKSWCNKCPTCNQIIYDPMGKWYLIESDVPNADIFTTHYGGIVIATEMLARIDRKMLKTIAVRDLPVYAKPKDGFPQRLADITPDLERVPPWTK